MRYGVIAPASIMCALGVPGYMIHGPFALGTFDKPDDSSVANGM